MIEASRKAMIEAYEAGQRAERAHAEKPQDPWHRRSMEWHAEDYTYGENMVCGQVRAYREFCEGWKESVRFHAQKAVG